MAALHWSRRRLLSAGSAVLTAALAGCADDPQPSDPPRDPRSGPPEGAITDLKTRSLRHEGSEQFLAFERTAGESGDGAGSDDDHAFFLLERDEIDALEFDPEPDGAGAFRAFLRATDFQTASVFVLQRPLGACVRLHADYVIAGADEFEAEFCRVLRDADVLCEADERHVVATAVRVPHVYEDRPRSLGYGSGSQCESGFWESTPGEGSG